jgi:REP element-mobilizing transposase RayT
LAAWFVRRTEFPKPSAARLTMFICLSVCAQHTRWRRSCKTSKQTSSRWIHETIGVKNFAWQPGYGAFTVSISNCDAVKEYIANQVEHHRTKTFQGEYVAFLQKHGVEYDEKYLW